MRTKAITLCLISNAALGMLLIFTPQDGSVTAQSGSSPQESVPKSYQMVSRETYNRVLDILFPRDDADHSKTVFAFVLRFKPNSRPESQIVIRRGVDKVEVVQYSLLDDDIYSKLNEALARTGREDAVEMAKAVRVKKRVVNVPLSQVKQWHSTFFDSLANTSKVLREKGAEFDKTGGSESVLLHGATYDLWYEQRLNKLSFSLYDVDLDEGRSGVEFNLVQWMDSVRRHIEKIKP